MTRAVLLAAVLVAGVAAPSDALVLCQQRNGALVARDACRKRERAVDPAALAPLGPRGVEGAAGVAGPPGTHPLRLVDAAGVELGPILRFFPTESLVEVRNPLLDRPVVFIVTPAGYYRYVSGGISSVYYQSLDCSGVPFIIPQAKTQVIAQVYGDFAYFSAEDPANRTYGSAEYDPDGGSCSGADRATGRATCCHQMSGTSRLQAGIRVALSSLGFTPPFRVEVR